MEELQYHIEALIFCSDNAVTVSEIDECLKQVITEPYTKEDIENSIQQLTEKYNQNNSAISLQPIGGGFLFLTKPEFHKTVNIFLANRSKKRLTLSALETISIIAYRQPISRSEIEKIRGVNCDYSMQKLLEKELIEIIGKGEGPGNPILYGTSQKFMDYFGLNSMNDLPALKEFNQNANIIGQEPEIESTTSF